MIDYKSMDNVIINLNHFADKLQKTVETQQKLNQVIDEVALIRDDVKKTEEVIEKYTISIKELEDEHNILNNQIEVILQDYKKLHSSFEFFEIELKKINEFNVEFKERQIDLIESTKGIETQIAELKSQNDVFIQKLAEMTITLEDMKKEAREYHIENLKMQGLYHKKTMQGMGVLGLIFGLLSVIFIIVSVVI